MKLCTELFTNEDEDLFSKIITFVSKINTDMAQEEIKPSNPIGVIYTNVREWLYQHSANGDYFTNRYDVDLIGKETLNNVQISITNKKASVLSLRIFQCN